MKKRFGVDGVMIGRASIGNPWFFDQVKHFMSTGEHLSEPDISARIEVCKKHLLKSIEWKGDKLGVLEMRRHYTNYFKGYSHFKPFRLKLVTLDDHNDILALLDKIKEKFSNGSSALIDLD